MYYLSENIKYNISYQELKEKHNKFCEMTHEEFEKNIVKALHLACIICFFKEIPTYVCLTDRGIIHELIHIIEGDDCISADRFIEVRKDFETVLKLS